MNRIEIIEKIKKFNEEIHRENYQHLIGLKDELNETKIYEKYKDIFTKENIKFLQKLLEESSGIDKRKNNYLLSYLISNYVGLKISKISDEAAMYEARATVKIDGKEIPFRGLRKIVAEEPSKEKRDRIYEIERPVKQKLLQYSIKLLKEDLKIISQLGYKDYIKMNQSLKEVDYQRLMETLKPFLIDTDYEYTKLVNKLLKKYNIEPSKATNNDFVYMARSPQFDEFFTKEKLVETLKKTLLGLGFNLDKQKNIELDIEDREKKVPRAFMMHIKIPEEIKLVIKPHGGHDDYNSMLHEAGHCEHYAHVDPKLDYELKHFGDHAVTEIFSFLFDNLMMDEHWLKNYTTMRPFEIMEFVQFSYLKDMYMFRRYISKLIYELKLFSNDLRKLDRDFNITNEKYKDFGECYSDILTKATKFRHPMNSYLLDIDGGFYVADYLRAWIGERQLRFMLKQKFGLLWFKDKKSGDFLKSLYQYGNSKNIYELMQEADFEGLDQMYIFQDFREYLDKEMKRLIV